MNNTKRNKERKALTYGLPAEISAGKTLMHVMNQSGCTLEGIYQIENYSSSILQIKVSWGKICFEGKNFCIEQMDGALLSFTGQIEGIRYLA